MIIISVTSCGSGYSEVSRQVKGRRCGEEVEDQVDLTLVPFASSYSSTIPPIMKGYLIDEDIPLTKLSTKLRSDAPTPKPKANEVLIDVYSAALNFFDVLQVAGKYQIKKPFPYIPGTEIAGVISKDSPIPEGCDFKPGDRVFGAANGSYADQVVADFIQLMPIPEGMSMDEASSLFITYPTSYAALVFRANVQEGETVLVHAGAGGGE